MRKRSEAKREREREHRERYESAQREFTIDVPNDPINEQIILAAQIADSSIRKKLVSRFPPEAFYAEPHRAIHAAFAELERRKLKYDPAVMMRIDPEIDVRILESLANSRPDLPPNLDFHVEMLSWDFLRAKATSGPISSLLEAVQNPKEEPERLKQLARQVGECFEGEFGKTRYIRDPKEIIRQSMQALRRRVAGEAYYPYGIQGLDYDEEGNRRIRPGAAPGTIAMITGLSGGGKSTITGHVALGIGRQKRKVLFGAWEETAPVTLEFLATLSLHWSRSKVLDGKSNRLREIGDFEPLNHEELVLIEEKMHAISKYVVFFDNPFQRGKTRTARTPTNDDHLDIIQDHLAESGAEVFIADLWQRCLVETRPEDERHALYRQLAIAEEQRCHVILVHQQRAKDIETRPDKRPTREGIIGSGAWLDVCWTVFAPHLPAKWKRVPDDTLELYILKQRNGPWPLCVEFGWDPDTGQISGGSTIPVHASAETSDAFDVPKNMTNRRGKKR